MAAKKKNQSAARKSAKTGVVAKGGYSLESVFQVWGWVLLLWSLYRYFFQFPEYVDEFLFKPLIFVGPVLFYVFNVEKRNLESIGINLVNFFPSVFAGIGLGVLFTVEGILVNVMQNGQALINPIPSFRLYGLGGLFVMSLATSLWEETLNRGFIFSRLYERSKNLLYAAFLASVLFVLLHVPILITTLKFRGPTLGLYFLTNMLLGLINCLLYARYRSITAPVLVHLFWNMAVALYF